MNHIPCLGGILNLNPSSDCPEPNPNLNFEHWGDYWRKVHGIRFLHSDEADDRPQLVDILLEAPLHRGTGQSLERLRLRIPFAQKV